MQGYEYDGVDRLVGWSVGTDTTAYSYDEVGNRQTRASMVGGATYTYGAPTTGPNRLTEREVVTVGSTERMYYGYNLNGSIVERKEYDQLAVPLPSLLSEEHFGYSYRELNWKYVNGNSNEDNHRDWRYRYNAMGEREQKRLYHAPLADSIVGQPYPWVHYLLGGSKDQLAVWHGQQMTSPFCDTVRRRNVFLYPTEYLTYGVGNSAMLITRPNGSKDYKIIDHLGSTRVMLSGSGMIGTDYEPFGEALSGGTESRRGYIDREEDIESSLRNHGVRFLDDNTGRFLSIDPLWEMYRSLTPYQYGANNPIIFSDPDGMKIDFGENKGLEEAFLQALGYAEEKDKESSANLRYLYESEDFTIKMVEVDIAIRHDLLI